MRAAFTVTNDLTYDQRMHRICGSLAAHGYDVTLIGRALPHSTPLEEQPFRQVRLNCRFNKGFLFYAEYNLRLFFRLMRLPTDAVCSIDLDTLPAGCLATWLRGKKRVFDAHEYFTEVPEVTDRPFVKAFWSFTARICLLFYRHAYTVGPALADVFKQRYKTDFKVIRNVPFFQKSKNLKENIDGVKNNVNKKILLYQGALNEGRGIEAALKSLQYLKDTELWLAGEGDLSQMLRRLAVELGVADNVRFLGYVKPDQLPAVTAQAWLCLNLLEHRGLSYYYSLANKFFAAVQVQAPVLTMNFPEYRALNKQHEVALLLDSLSPEAISEAVQRLSDDPALYVRLQAACEQARQEWCWEKEEKALLEFWSGVW
jgi:glycosyltransferase involved in cell wall biosynthesis